jgi:capsid protein
MSGAIPEIDKEDYFVHPEKYQAARFKPRGWNWVDPTKEVEAYKEAVRCGFTTVSRVIEQTGNGDDLEDILTEREEELRYMHEKGLIFDTDPSVDAKGKTAEPAADNAEAAPAASGQDAYASYTNGHARNGTALQGVTL